MSPPAEPMAAAGQLLLGKYRLIRPLGSGGMGEVWLARNEGTDREFAIKLLLAKYAADADMLSRFMREAKVSGRVRHPGVVEVFDVARAPELDGAVFLVMEVLEGASLHDLVSRQKRIPLGFLLDVGIELSHALGALHDKGVIHRDIKPSNIFLHRDPSGRFVPKLLDFGISKMEAAPDEGELTRSGTIVGSPRYMSPEQAAGRKDVDARADVHGLGVTLWTCAAGYSPFDSSNYNNMIVSVITTDRQPLREVVPEVPEGVSLVIARAIHRSRELRHANGHELARALEDVRGLVQDGSSLQVRQWVEQLIAAPPASVVSSLPPGPSDASRSIGAVSVSFDEPGYQQTARRVFQEAPTSELPAAASSVADPHASLSPSRAASRPRSRRILAMVALGAGAIALLAVAERLVLPSSAARSSSTAASTASLAPQAETPLPPPVTAPPLVTTATAMGTAPTELDAAANAGGAPAAPVNALNPVTPARPPKRAPTVRAPSQPAPVAADPNDPHHGVTSSGL